MNDLQPTVFLVWMSDYGHSDLIGAYSEEVDAFALIGKREPGNIIGGFLWVEEIELQ